MMSFFNRCRVTVSHRIEAVDAHPVGRFFLNVGYGVSKRFSLLSTVLVATLLTEVLLKQEFVPSAFNLSAGLFVAIPVTGVFIILEIVRRYLNQHKLKQLTEEKGALNNLHAELLKEHYEAKWRGDLLLRTRESMLHEATATLLTQKIKANKTYFEALERHLRNPSLPHPAKQKIAPIKVEAPKIEPFQFLALKSYETCQYLKEAPKADADAESATSPLRVLTRNTLYQQASPLLTYKFFSALLHGFPEAVCASIVGSLAHSFAFNEQDSFFSTSNIVLNLLGAALVGVVAVIAGLVELSGLETQVRDEEREVKHLEKIIDTEARNLYALKTAHEKRSEDLTILEARAFAGDRSVKAVQHQMATVRPPMPAGTATNQDESDERRRLLSPSAR